MNEKDRWHIINDYIQLPEQLFTPTEPTPVENPELVLFNESLAKKLGLEFLSEQKDEALEVLSGNKVIQNTQPIAQSYGGHQFGYFNVLGDGRAILLGEIQTENQLFDLQLKGSGQTTYSRRGDGRATLYSMLREYLISEAMAGLNIPTSRSLAVVSSDTPVYREEVHNAGVLTRIASSHIRVGTFELAVRMGNPSVQKALFEYAAKRHYPEVFSLENPALEFFKKVVAKQISLVTKWMSFGFIHGVMNTDNVSIAGETFDYGPCAFMNGYNPKTVFSYIDEDGRYAYQNQPPITHWNLARLGESLLPLIHENRKIAIELATPVLDGFKEAYETLYVKTFIQKLGISEPQKGDEDLLFELLNWMENTNADFTNTFRGLSDPHLHEDVVFESKEFLEWKEKWAQRVAREPHWETIAKANNPSIIPRNHVVEEALTSAAKQNDFTLFNQLLAKVQNPFESCKEPKFQTPPISESGYQTFCGT